MQCLLHLNKHFTPFSLSFHWMSRYMSTLFSSLIASLADIFCLFLAVAHRKMWDGLYISGDCIPWLSVMYIEWVHRAKLASVCAEWRRHQHVGLYYVSLLIQTLCHISQPEITIQLLETEVIGSHWWSKCPHFWFRGSLMVAAEAAGEFSECSWSWSSHRSSRAHLNLSSWVWVSWSITKHQSVSDIRSGSDPRQYLYHE